MNCQLNIEYIFIFAQKVVEFDRKIEFIKKLLKS